MRKAMVRLAAAVSCIVLAGVMSASARAAPQETVTYSFIGGADGGAVYGGVITDRAGNLYGTTAYGGAYGYGTVFKVTPGGKETVLHSFTGGADGSSPATGLVADRAGNLYGTTDGGAYGYGNVFKITCDGVETVLYSFTGGTDGSYPEGDLITDRAGNLYGTTFYGGASGYGTVFKVTPGGDERVLYSFTNGVDGRWPYAGVITDRRGNLYGPASSGYGFPFGGVVFKITPNGTETTLYTFCTLLGCPDGDAPNSLIIDREGDLYGTTQAGGAYDSGAVFKLTAGGAETVLYSFTGIGADGSDPNSELIADRAGNLYGTTVVGGAYGYGIAFKVTPDGAETVLHTFTGGADGGQPLAGLINCGGNLYGTTEAGGAYQDGTVFELTDTGFVSPQHNSGLHLPGPFGGRNCHAGCCRGTGSR